METSIVFNKKKEIKEFGKFVAQMVREGVHFRVDFNEAEFIVILNGGC